MPQRPPEAGPHPHLASPAAPGRLRMDCHLHTVLSGDAVTTLDDVLAVGARRGLDVIAVTDHHAVAGAQELARRSADAGGPRIVVGEEIRTPVGEIVGLFLSQRVPYVLPLLDAAARVRDQGGLVYAPHPFDSGRTSLGRSGLEALAEHGLLDVVEAFNAKVSRPDMNAAAAAAAAGLGVPVAAGSDAHDPEGIGAAFVELPAFEGPAQFLTALGRASIAGHLFAHAARYPHRPAGAPPPAGAPSRPRRGQAGPAAGPARPRPLLKGTPSTWT